ncbi:putative Tc1-like transposase DDE domain-containing protein [Seiridium unicorne]|uniref:Tc1-like transposase DDE domain-containing protein n=1 Tax=Seiridium unicorne TaxID=138068 RepID=A0ABR2V5A7_9PEZI
MGSNGRHFAYTQTGVKLSRFFFGSVDKALFEDFSDQLLHHCERVQQMCKDAGMKSGFIAPYTPRTSPIEEFFGQVKTYMKSERNSHSSLIQKEFESHVKSSVKAVGSRQSSAEGHFRNAGLYVEQPPEETM